MCGKIFRIVAVGFLIYILFDVIDDLDRNKKKAAGAPAPYLLEDGSAHLVQRFEFSPPFDSALLNDPRVGPGLIATRREIALTTEDRQSLLFYAVGDRYSGTLTIKGGIKRELPVNATGLGLCPSVIDMPADESQEEDHFPDEKDPRSHVAYVNVTCVAKTRSALENTITLAQIATNTSKVGITLASDSAFGPADITVLMDVTLPKVLNQKRLEASADSLDIFASYISGPFPRPGDSEDDLLRLHMKDMTLQTTKDTKIGTDGVILVTDQMVISSVDGDLNLGAVSEVFDGDIRIKTQSGSASLGMLVASRGLVDLQLLRGTLKSQLVNGDRILIVSDSAAISGSFSVKSSFTAESNSGDIDIAIAPVSLEKKDHDEAVQTEVDVRGRTGSVQVVYTNQRRGTKLFSRISSRVGHVAVHHHPNFQGDFDISDRDLTGLITLNIPQEKGYNATHANEGATAHLFGSVWLKEDTNSKDVWGRSDISSLVAPIAAYL